MDVCHDGAIFHFFIEESQRMKYLEQEVRYETEKFHGQFGKSFKPIDSSTVIHKTPMGNNSAALLLFFRMELGFPT